MSDPNGTYLILNSLSLRAQRGNPQTTEYNVMRLPRCARNDELK